MADDYPFNRGAARYHRVRRGLSLVELAARCHVHNSTLSRVEHGKRRPTPGLIAAMAHALEVDVEELLIKPVSGDSAA